MPVTNYIWDVENDTCLMETDENGATKVVYSHEPTQFGGLISQRRDGETYYHHYDALGSTRQLTDADENVTDEYVYTAWGEPVVASGTTENPYRWVGRWGYYWDEARGTYYVRRRDYQPTIARWRSLDPLGFVDGPNRYAYVTGTPVWLVDPWGLFEISVDTEGARGGVRDMPVYYDAALKDWPSVSALNNLCIRINAECDGPYSLRITGVEFRLFITVGFKKIDKDDEAVGHFLGIYGHEQAHLAQMIKEIREVKRENIEDYLRKLDGIDLCDCDSFRRWSLPTSFTEAVWELVGHAFMHAWTDEEARTGRVGWGRPKPAQGRPRNYDDATGFPDRKDAKLPFDGVDGWFCSMDQVLKVDRAWPDWEFAPPGKLPPFEGVEGKKGHPLPNKRGEFYPQPDVK
jgi:RHS repeat-associated protein